MERLVSLDLFRGATVAAMIFVNTPGDWGHVLWPFGHAEWHGWTPTDLIFPFFLFIVGTAGVLSLEKRSAHGASRTELARHVLVRGATIVLVGWLMAAFPFTWDRVRQMRIPGVLPRIGVVYVLGTLLLLAAGKRRALGAAAAVAGLLALHTYLLTGLGYDLTREGNVQTAVDLAVLKGHLWKPHWDPEGIVSTLTATATMLTGSLTGLLLVSRRRMASKLFAMVLAGAAGVAAGTFWNASGLPINKGLWTGSYVLLTTGAALLSLAAAILVVDVLGVRRPWGFFLAFGRNPLLAFVLSGFFSRILGLVRFRGVTLQAFLYRHAFSWIHDPYLASHAWAVATVLLFYLAMRVCDRRGWYWKV